MTKKLAFVGLFTLCVLLAVPAFGQTFIKYMGGQVLFAGDTEKPGAGSVGGLGIQLSENMIVWAVEVENEKTHEGDKYDYILAGTTVLWPDVVETAHLGIFLNAGIGGGGSEEEETHTYGSTIAGLYFNVHKEKRMNLYIGGGYSYVGGDDRGFGNYSVHFGLSFAKL